MELCHVLILGFVVTRCSCIDLNWRDHQFGYICGKCMMVVDPPDANMNATCFAKAVSAANNPGNNPKEDPSTGNGMEVCDAVSGQYCSIVHFPIAKFTTGFRAGVEVEGFCGLMGMNSYRQPGGCTTQNGYPYPESVSCNCLPISCSSAPPAKVPQPPRPSTTPPKLQPVCFACNVKNYAQQEPKDPECVVQNLAAGSNANQANVTACAVNTRTNPCAVVRQELIPFGYDATGAKLLKKTKDHCALHAYGNGMLDTDQCSGSYLWNGGAKPSEVSCVCEKAPCPAPLQWMSEPGPFLEYTTTQATSATTTAYGILPITNADDLSPGTSASITPSRTTTSRFKERTSTTSCACPLNDIEQRWLPVAGNLGFALMAALW